MPVVKDCTLSKGYKLCANYTDHNICNWALSANASGTLCAACGLTSTIPDLSVESHRDAWLKLEIAKRRLVFDLLSLKLPWRRKGIDAEHGLEFRFLSDVVTVNGDHSRVLTGHDNGLITSIALIQNVKIVVAPEPKLGFRRQSEALILRNHFQKIAAFDGEIISALAFLNFT